MSGDPDATPAEARVADAAAERRRLRAVQEEGSRQTSMRAVLIGVAEQAADVSLVVAGGRSHRVRVTAVGVDVVVATSETRRLLLVGFDAVCGVVTHRGSIATARRDAASVLEDDAYSSTLGEWTMGDILAHWLDSQPRMTTWWGDEPVSGALAAVGRDVATMTVEGSGALAYVRLDSTTEISLSVPSSL